MMRSENRLNKQGDSRQLCHTPFLISCSIQDSNCCFLTHIQDSQETVMMVWYSQLFKFSQFVMTDTVKGFSIVNETEVEVLEGIALLSL